MPRKKRIAEELPSEELLLAAIDRADRHQRRQENPGVRLASVKEHLGLARGGASTMRLRPLWDALHAAGLIEQSLRHGRPLWRLTNAGIERLQAARQRGELEALPESPQHRDWREARSAAGERIGGFRNELRAALSEAGALLDAEPPTGSGAWCEARERLRKACSRLGSAIYCLHEWEEPDDEKADIAPEAYWERRGYRRWPDA